MRNSIAEIFDTVLDSMRREHGDTAVDLWLSKATVSDFNGKTVTLLTENILKKNILIQRYLSDLEEAFSEAYGKKLRVIVTSLDDIAKEDQKEFIEENEIFNSANKPDLQKEKQSETVVEKDDTFLDKSYTFDNFVVGSSNKMAQSACLAVATNPITRINPLFLYGPSGLGKTHLLFAIMNEVRKRDENFRMLYVTGEQFTNEMIESLSTKTTVAFREKYRRVDMLLVDDIQFIAGKMSVQEEFFNTFDTLYKMHKQIVLTSDKPPKNIDLLEERLRTRFEMGLITDIQPPDPELRIAIFKQKTSSLGLTIPTDVLAYLAENIRSNIRQIEGAVKKLWAQSFIANEEITLEMAEETLADIIIPNVPAVTTNLIFDILERRYGIHREELLGKRRSADVVYVRHIAIYLIQEYTDMSLKKTGKLFGRDHSTIISARDGVIARMKNDAGFSKEISDIRVELEQR